MLQAHLAEGVEQAKQAEFINQSLDEILVEFKEKRGSSAR